MREQDERSNVEAEPTADLGAALLQIATPLEKHAEDEAMKTVHQALTMQDTIGTLELAQLTDRLLTQCAGLTVGIETIPADERPVRGRGALRDWAQLQQDGPGDGPLGTWSYARQLAVVARSMVTALREHRETTEGRAPYIGRPGLPPLTPSSP
ncbi:hypothetical protein EAO70_16165 [Streptomyces sp. adm13(2018)]|uniref:hypothetical protein n=1 Tax=Streptomyces sp. adm13(2018) TaxID=2479007 RepID=UPI0011CE8E5E|nr:hypothetical protein [Streptomyces sp. adm13(2018)]TXS15536.1 hypothetical protein EAO70_16165 [Streptomyces sp. adm13(2018)]